MHPQPYQEALTHLYDAPLQPASWAKFIRCFARVIDAHDGQYCLWNAVERRMDFAVVMNDFDDAEAAGSVAAADADRALPALIDSTPVGTWVFNCGHFDERCAASCPASGRARARSLGHAAGVRLTVGPQGVSSLGLFRARRGPPFGAAERSWLERVTPHLQRASRLHLEVEELRRGATLGIAAADGLDQPIVIASREARIAFANRSGNAALADRSGALCALGGKLCGRTAASQDALIRALQRATATTSASASAFSCAFGSGPRLHVVVSPLQADCGFAAAWQRPLALITLSTPHARMPDASMLRGAFGFTPAEARLVGALTHGVSIAAYAAAASISINTARSQLRSAMQKADTHRQSDLVRLVHGLPCMRA